MTLNHAASSDYGFFREAVKAAIASGLDAMILDGVTAAVVVRGNCTPIPSLVCTLTKYGTLSSSCSHAHSACHLHHGVQKARISCGIYAGPHRHQIEQEIDTIVTELLWDPPGTCGGGVGSSGGSIGRVGVGAARGSLLPQNTIRGAFFSTVVIADIL